MSYNFENPVKTYKNNIIKTVVFFLVIFIITLLSWNIAQSQTKYSKYSLYTGLSLDGNWFISDFNSIPGTKSCIHSFESAFSIKPGFNIGFDYRISENEWNIPFRLFLNAKYQNLSADYSEEEFVGYVIKENTYSKGTVEYFLNTNIQAIGLETGLEIEPFKVLPLSFKLFYNIAIPFKNDFEQGEFLISPNDVYFENGER